MGDNRADLMARVSKLEEQMSVVQSFCETRLANITTNKKLLDLAARRIHVRRVILLEESQGLDTQKEFLNQEESILRNFMEFAKRSPPAPAPPAAAPVNAQSSSKEQGTNTEDSRENRTTDTEVEVEEVKPPPTELPEEPMIRNRDEAETSIPFTPTFPFTIEALERLNQDENEVSAAVAVGEKRSSRGRLIKPKYKLNDTEDWVSSSPRAFQAKSKSPAARTSPVKDSVGSPPMTPNISEKSENVAPLNHSNSGSDENSAEAGIEMIVEAVNDAHKDVNTAEQDADSKVTKPQEGLASPVRHSMRNRKQREPSPDSNSVMSTDDSDSDSESQPSPKKLRVKKLAARNIRVYIPFRRLPQLRQRTPVPPSPAKVPASIKKESKAEPQQEIKRTSRRRNLPQKCAYCPKVFNTSHGRTYHELNHQGQKPHKCDLCEKAFVQKALLKRHMLVHSGEPKEKKHQCKVCSHSFAIKYDLVLHSKRHDPARQQECGVCKKKYSDPKYFKKHVARCTEESQNLKCPNCFRQYSIRPFFEKHLEVCHAENNSGSGSNSLTNSDIVDT